MRSNNASPAFSLQMQNQGLAQCQGQLIAELEPEARGPPQWDNGFLLRNGIYFSIV